MTGEFGVRVSAIPLKGGTGIRIVIRTIREFSALSYSLDTTVTVDDNNKIIAVYVGALRLTLASGGSGGPAVSAWESGVLTSGEWTLEVFRNQHRTAVGFIVHDAGIQQNREQHGDPTVQIELWESSDEA